MMFGYGFGPFSALGGVFMLIWWIFVIILVVWIIRALVGHRHFDHHFSENDKTPLDILKERYAKGEVNKKEFEEMKKDLE